MNSSAVNYAWKWWGMNGRNSELSFHAEFEFPFGLVGQGQQVIWIWVSVRKSKTNCGLVVVVQSLSCVWLFVTPWAVAARLPCPSLSPGVCSNSCPLSWWCHPTISSSVTPFSSCPQSFPASGSFPMSQFFASGGQSIWNFNFSISPSLWSNTHIHTWLLEKP